MTDLTPIETNPELDLVLERTIDIPVELVWEAWTTPAHVKEWFAPKPWTIGECEIDLRPGGIFHSVLQSPEGDKYPNTGCYLEVTPNRRLIWTSALLPGYRPATVQIHDLLLTAVLDMEPTADGKGTKYTARAIHNTPEARKQHEEMGFAEGWGTVLDQLVEFMKEKKGLS